MNTTAPCILVVEDHRPLLNVIRDLLEVSGYTSVAALGGSEALQAMEEVRPDLIISDIMMPRMDGYALYDAVRARPEWASIPFIFLTARTDEEHRLRAQELGVDGFITKPVGINVLLDTVSQQLDEGDRKADQAASREETMLSPTETDVDTLLEYIWTGAKAQAPQLDSLRLCGQAIRWDLSLLRGDQLEALDAVASHGTRFRAPDVPQVHLAPVSPSPPPAPPA